MASENTYLQRPRGSAGILRRRDVKLLMPLAILAGSVGLLASEWTGRAFGYL